MIDLYEPQDFYPPEIAIEKIAEIDKWLKSTEPRKLDRVSIEADQLDAETIKKIEDAAAALPSNVADVYTPKRINGVPRQALLHPTHAEGRLQSQAFAVGDRVVYVQNSGKVDIAMRGTVVGINTDTLDVVFDGNVMSGSTLGGRCSENRGSIVPKSSVLNLTNPTVVALSKAALQRKPDTVASGASSRTGSPAGHATRSQFNRTNGQPGRGRGGKWYTPWGINAPQQNLSVKPSGVPKQGSPFNPTMLLRKSEAGVTPAHQASQPMAHQYNNGVAIPPPSNLDQRQRIRSGPPKPAGQQPRSSDGAGNSPHTNPRGGANGFRGSRGGRGASRGGATNGSPSQPGRGGRGRGRGRGHETAPV
jgi:5'-3' exoribonuclease 1